MPLNEVARVRVPNVKTWVVLVDGKSTRDWQGSLLTTSEVHLKPGTHQLAVLHTRNESVLTHERANATLDVNVEAGHFYTVTYRDVDKDKVVFNLRDHGTTYEAQCASVVKLPNMNVYMGLQVPAECY